MQMKKRIFIVAGAVFWCGVEFGARGAMATEKFFTMWKTDALLYATETNTASTCPDLL